MIPTITPIFTISFCCTRFVEKAKAFGGVLTGRIIALEAAMATPIYTVGVPPMAASLSPMAEHTTARMGMSSAAVAELLMKFDKM